VREGVELGICLEFGIWILEFALLLYYLCFKI